MLYSVPIFDYKADDIDTINKDIYNILFDRRSKGIFSRSGTTILMQQQHLDIEDLASTTALPERHIPKAASVSYSSKRVTGVSQNRKAGRTESPTNSGSEVPGSQSIWVKTFGCSHNTSDAEFMAGQLHEYG